jgi:multidrug resistance efflux pump
MEPLLSHGYVSAEDVDRARVAQRATQAELSAALLTLNGQMLGEEIALTKAPGGGYRANPPVELTPR